MEFSLVILAATLTGIFVPYTFLASVRNFSIATALMVLVSIAQLTVSINGPYFQGYVYYVFSLTLVCTLLLRAVVRFLTKLPSKWCFAWTLPAAAPLIIFLLFLLVLGVLLSGAGF